MSNPRLRTRVAAAFALFASVLLAFVLVLAAPAAATLAPAMVIVPDKAALEVADPAERLAVDAYFDAGTGAPFAVSFTGSIALGDLTLDGDFTLTKSAVAGVAHNVTITGLTITHAPSGPGGISVEDIAQSTFEWGLSGFTGTVTDRSVTAFAGNSGTGVGLEVDGSAFYLRVASDSSFAYSFEGSGSLVGADELSITGTVIAEWNSTGTAINETVAIGEETVSVSMPDGAQALFLDFGLLGSTGRPLRLADIHFAQTGPAEASDTSLLFFADEVLTRLGGIGEPRLLINDATMAGVLMPDGSHALQGSGPASFENLDETNPPAFTGSVTFEENTSGAAINESFSVAGSTVELVVDEDPPGFSAPDLEFQVLGKTIRGSAIFSQNLAKDLELTFVNGEYSLGGEGSAVGSFIFSGESLVISSEGVRGSLGGDLSLTAPDVSATGSPTLEIDTTTLDPFVDLQGSGLQLVINGHTITGDVLFEETTTDLASPIVVVSLSNGATSFRAGSEDVISLTNVGGGLLLTADGIAAELAVDATVNGSFTPTIFAGSPLLLINTMGVAVAENFSVAGSAIALDLEAGPYFRLLFPSSSLRVPAAILNGDFIVEEIQLGGTVALRWAMANISFDTGSGGMSGGEGAFLTTEAGTAGSIQGDGIFADPTRIGLRHNDTGGAVDETIELNGADFRILFGADEGDISVVFVDVTDPVASIASPVDGMSVFPGDPLTAVFLCADIGGSGLVSCSGSVDGTAADGSALEVGPVSSGAALDTSIVGTFTLTVVATDGVGNTDTTTSTFVVKQRRPGDDQVARLYQAAFARTPDPVGLGFWTGVYRQGATLEQIAARLLASPEALAIYGEDGSDEDYVRALYINALGRPADSGGLNFWLTQLASSSRAALLVSFSESPENIERTNTTPPLTSQASKIVRLYQAAFGRAPDESGQLFWEMVFADGASLRQIATQFLGSPEAKARFGDDPQDADFIDAMYRNVLGRPGDTGGVEFWLAEMRSGATTVDVLVRFSESLENIDRTGTRP